MITSDLRCPHLRWEAYSDSSMNTVLARPDIVLTNKNDITKSDFTVNTNTAMCDSVYLNTYSYGR